MEIEINKNKNPDNQKETKILKFSILDWETIPLMIGQESGHVHSLTGYLKVWKIIFSDNEELVKEIEKALKEVETILNKESKE